MRKVAAFLLIGMLIASSYSWAGVSDAAEMTKDKTVALAGDIGGIPVHAIGLVASLGWMAGEVVVFPFRWIAKPFIHKSPY